MSAAFRRLMKFVTPIFLLIFVLRGQYAIAVQKAEASKGPPIILYTDIESGPNNGGENNNGAYLSVFGKNFGHSSGLGKSTRLFIGNTEVSDYRLLRPSRGRMDVDQLTVQVGNLGGQKVGVPLPLRVSVDGRTSNTDKFFTISPGLIYYVSLEGNDSTGKPGHIASPYRTVQRSSINNNGTMGCPTIAGNQPVPLAGVWGLIRPGDMIVLRGGRWTDVSKDGFFFRVQNKAGTRPTGEVGTGPITIMGYPGEDVVIDRSNHGDRGHGGGGISSADKARQALGCGAWINVSNLIVESGFSDGPINTQEGHTNPGKSHWRVVNNELTAVSCKIHAQCRGAGVAGSGTGNFWVGNYVHDVHDQPDCCSSFENHGFYVQGDGSYEIAYNRIERIFGGNGIQTYGGSADTIRNVIIHHNMIRDIGKHGLNIANGTESGVVIFNNVIHSTDVAGMRLNSRSLIHAQVYNNTFFDTDRLEIGGTRAAIMNDQALGQEAMYFKNNIVVPGGNRRNYIGGDTGFAALSPGIVGNLWFDGRLPGLLGNFVALPGIKNIRADPRFISRTVAAIDLHLRAESPAVDSGISDVNPIVQDDFDAVRRRPVGKGIDIGAFEWVP